MDSYTEKLETTAAVLVEYEAIDKLPEIIASFRGHGAALSEFLNTHGYPASGADTPKAKADFLKRKFREAGIDGTRARNALQWLTSPKGFDRESGFRIAFALGLDIEETNEFFRTVLLDRGFDCHIIREAVYYYCVSHRKGYPEAEKLIAEAPDPEKTAVPFSGDILYTGNIISFIRSCESDEALIRYFHENAGQFAYNQVKAKEFIRSLWKRIAKPEGSAELERKFFPDDDKPLQTGASYSTWEIYLQILGLDYGDAENIRADRTIKPILENHVFMHEFAAENYPTRQSIEKLLRGENAKQDLTRKTLILLAFYQFWMNAALSRGARKSYEAGEHDCERCLDELDQYLLDAGFPELYAGNPYDWIFLWAANREAPLTAFRDYMKILSAEYSEHGAA